MQGVFADRLWRQRKDAWAQNQGGRMSAWTAICDCVDKGDGGDFQHADGKINIGSTCKTGDISW